MTESSLKALLLAPTDVSEWVTVHVLFPAHLKASGTCLLMGAEAEGRSTLAGGMLCETTKYLFEPIHWCSSDVVETVCKSGV